MEFRLLGPVEAGTAGQVVSLGPRQQRLVFAVLALELDRPISVDRLVELVWPTSPPRTASHAIRVCVSRLRALLADHVELLARGTGYLLRTDPMRIDVHRFRALLDEAGRADSDSALVATLGQALDLWRGPALADTAPEDVRHRLCAGLEESRLIAVEDRFAALLRLGRHHAVVGELTALAQAHPTRERLIGQLMLALHRDGQASRALEVGRRTREHLSDELGTDPGRELRELELAILRNDPAIELPKPVDRPVVRPAVTPAQLPPNIADFTGRAAQLRKLDDLAAVVVTIAGTAGVGKTALAVRWAYQVRGRFPDGQLYVNLGGYAAYPPLQPEQALAQFLRAVGVPPEQVPLDLAEASGMYRTLLADKRMLVLLDNAASAEQVRPLLPGGDGCLALVTSRNRLDGLVAMDAARRVALDVLPPDDAVALLSRMLGAQRVEAEPDATAALAQLCACLPLALRIAAAHLANHPDRRVADHVAALRRDSPLTSLRIDGDEQTAVRVAFDLSYAALTPDAQRLFRLLGLVPGQDFSVDSATALAGRDSARLLDRLAAVHLIDQHVPGRYRFHDLLRRYAWEQTHDQDGEQERDAAIERLFDHYLDSATAATDVLYPGIIRLPAARASAVAFSSNADALAWLDAENANLVAGVQFAGEHGPQAMTWLLADTLRAYFYSRRQFLDWYTLAETALRAAGAQHQPQAQAAAHLSLSSAHYSQNQYARAIEHLEAALPLCQEAGWLLGEIAVVGNLGMMHEAQGDLALAARRHNEALVLYPKAGAMDRAAPTLIHLGSVEQFQGHLDEAAGYFGQALAIVGQRGSHHSGAESHSAMGAVSYQRGKLESAVEHCTRACSIYQEIGWRNHMVLPLATLADVHRAAGRHDQALDNGHAALAVAVDTGERRLEALARNAVGAVHRALGHTADAAEHYRLALDIAGRIGSRYQQCQALIGLAACDLDPDYAHHALSLARDAGYRLLEGEALTALADIESKSGDTDRAVEHARQALAIHRASGYQVGQDQALLVLERIS